jgi:hypothetical protein
MEFERMLQLQRDDDKVVQAAMVGTTGAKTEAAWCV